MNLIASFATLAVAHLGQALRSLHALLSAPMHPPRPVPIPIRVDRRTSDLTDRPTRRRH